MDQPVEVIHRADAELLASLGYKQEFKRAFTPLEVFGIAFSIIGLLPSIASVLSNAIPNGGGPAMVWGWAAASFFILLVGMSMAELSSSAPTSGGASATRVQLPVPLLLTIGLLTALFLDILALLIKVTSIPLLDYANTIGSIASVASIDWGCALQIMAAATIGSSGSFVATSGQKFAVYIAILIANAMICSLGTAVLARLQTIYVVLNVLLCLAIIVALPIATPSEYRNTAHFALGKFVNLGDWTDGYAFIMSFILPLWTISSFDACVHISEEATNAATAVPWAIILAILISGVLGWAINMSLAFNMGTELQALYDSDQPMAQILYNSFGQKGTLVVWTFVVIVQFMMGSSQLLVASRQTFAFSRDGALPLSGWLYRMNGYTGTPVNTVIYDAALAGALGLLVFAGDQAINAVFSISINALYIAYAIPIAAIFMGSTKYKPGPFSLGIFSIPVAVVSVLFMATFTVVFLFPSSSTPTSKDMNYTVIVLGGVMCLSTVWYYLPQYGGRYWFTGPVTTAKSQTSHESSGLDSN